MPREVRVAILGDARDYQRAVQVADRATMDLDGSAKRVGDTVDKNRSVVANFAGNAVQDLPGVSGAFGAMNVAAGQFAEYATEGDINMRAMVGQIGGMLAIGAAIGIVSKEMGKAAENARKNREQIEEWTEGIREGKTAVDAMVEAMEETGKVEFVLPFVDDDITEDLAKLGLTIEQFGQLTQASQEEVEAWTAEMEAAGADGEAVMSVLIALGVAQENQTKATEQAAIQTAVFGEATKETTGAVDDATIAVDSYTDAIKDWEEAVSNLIPNELDLREAVRDSEDAVEDYIETMGDAEATDRDRARAADGVIAAFLHQAEVAGQSAEGQAIAAGRAESATREGVAAQIWELGKLAGTLEPGSYLRQQIEGHIDALNRIPRTVATNITVSGNAAGPRVGARAAGGPVSAGSTYLVGEEGPELFTPNRSGQIIANGTPIGGGGGEVVHVHLNLDGRQIDDALVRLKRRNGTLGFQ